MAYSISSVKENLENFSLEHPEIGENVMDNCLDLRPHTEEFLRYIFRFLCINFNKQHVLSVNEHKGLPKNRSSTSYRAYYFPSHIQDDIVNSHSITYNYKFKIRQRDINVDLVSFKKTEHEESESCNHKEMINLIYNWLLLATNRIPPTCSRTLHITIFLTNYKKEFPTQKAEDERIRVDNVNSAYTTSCDIDTSIVIYRKEEWFKVLIHETFHCLGLDFSHRDFDHTPYLNTHFSFRHVNYKVFESYCETWARIMNTCFTAFCILPKKSMKYKDLNYFEFSTSFSICFYYEILFSAKQMNKVLRHNNLHFDDLLLINKRKGTNEKDVVATYRESTSVISYYIFTNFLIGNFQTFIQWCYDTHKKGSNIFQFDDTNKNIRSYCDLIYTASKCDNVLLLQDIFSQSKYEPKHSTTLMMSYIPGPMCSREDDVSILL